MRKYLLIIPLTFVLTYAIQTSYNAEVLPDPPQESREELYHDLFITLLLPYIDKGVEDYYSELLTDSPIVYPYMVKVVSAERDYGYRSFRFSVMLEVTPVVGPHISVGKDKLTFAISSRTPKLIEYNHIETHQLPEHWKHLIKP